MIAYHGREDLKAAFLAQIAQHETADRIVRGVYSKDGQDETLEFTGGCAVGCSLQSLAVIEGLATIDHSDHTLYERYLGVPQMLARLEDRIFEGLPEAEAQAWPRRFAEAIRPGADLAMVGPRFLYDLLSDPAGAVQRRAQTTPRVKAAVDGVMALFVRWVESGTKPSATEWREARSAAYAAAADASAADADAYAAAADASAAAADAYAADADAAYAADAAAYAAYTDAAAAYAADAAAAAAYAAAYAAARASRSQECQRQSVSLLRLLGEAGRT